MDAETIRRMRTELGWSQTKLAAELGTDVGTVSRWERGIKAPRPMAQKALEYLEQRTRRQRRQSHLG